MEFEGGRTASFTMIAFSESISIRKTRIYGTLGELGWRLCWRFDLKSQSSKLLHFVTNLDCDGSQILHTDFRREGNVTTYYNPRTDVATRMSGHDYADYHLMKAFIEAVFTGNASKVLSGPDETLESHLIVFAAEKSRLQNCVVNITNMPLDR